MTVFSIGESDWNRLDYRLVLHRVALYYSEAILAEDVEWLRTAQYTIHEFDCRKWISEMDFHDDVATRFDFPDYYGRNLNAFADCIGDLEVPEEGGVTIVLTSIETLALRDPKLTWHILDILAGVTIGNILFGRRFFTLAQSNDPHIKFEPVGAVHIDWNNREWLNSKRGL